MTRPLESLSVQEFLKEKEAAQLLRLTPRTLKKWRSQKKGPPFVRFGNRVRYPRKSLEEWSNGQLVN